MPAQGVWRRHGRSGRPSVVRPMPEPERGIRWRTVDIVVTAVLGVAFGVVFWAWGLLWAATGAAFTAFPPAQAVMYGVWLLPAVLAPLIVRKPGAGAVRRAASPPSSPRCSAPPWGTLVLRLRPAAGPGRRGRLRRVPLPPLRLAAGAARRRARRGHGRRPRPGQLLPRLDRRLEGRPTSSSWWSAPRCVAGARRAGAGPGPGAPAARCRSFAAGRTRV